MRGSAAASFRPLAPIGAILFGLAFGHVEAVVVVFIRFAVTGTLEPAAAVDARALVGSAFPWWIEVTREAATIVMLAGVALAAGRSLWERIAFFLFAFAIWDAQYYLSLRLLTGWPASLDTIDVYFLIPFPWGGPVWLPLLLDALLIALTRRIWLPRLR